jgi:uncharacterized protein (TIGR02452 family)
MSIQEQNLNDKSFYNHHSWKHEDWLRIFLQTKSMTDEQLKKKMFRFLRGSVFRANVSISNSGYYINNKGETVQIDNSLGSSSFYSEPEVVSNELLRRELNTTFDVVNKDSIDAAEDLIMAGLCPAALIMACEDGPGGGVIGGCYGQEEGLFRRTDLFRYMYPYCKHAKEYGVEESVYQYPLDKCFGGVYVHDALVFRDVENTGYMLKDSPLRMSFIAVPAIREPILTKDSLLNPYDTEITLNKIRTIFRLGLNNGHDSLVLGAWGCGIFKNPPHHIALLFKSVLEEDEFLNQFKHISFAILEDRCSNMSHNPKGNYAPFKMVFK